MAGQRSYHVSPEMHRLPAENRDFFKSCVELQGKKATPYCPIAKDADTGTEDSVRDSLVSKKKNRTTGEAAPRQATLSLSLRAMEALAQETLSKRHDESLGWGSRGGGGDLALERIKLSSLFKTLHLAAGKYPRATPFALLESLEWQGQEHRLVKDLLQDPRMAELDALAVETDAMLRNATVANIATRWARPNLGLGQTADFLARELGKDPPDRPGSGGISLFDSGHRVAAERFELGMMDFFNGVSTPSLLLGMAVAPFIGGAFEVGALKIGLHISKGTSLGWKARGLATVAGMAGEALGFTTLHRTINSFDHDPDKAWEHAGKEVLSTGLLFGALRLAHNASGYAITRMAEGRWGTDFGGRIGRTSTFQVLEVSPTGRLQWESLVPGSGMGAPYLTGLGQLIGASLSHGGGIAGIFFSTIAGKRLGLEPEGNRAFKANFLDAALAYFQAVAGFRLANLATGGLLMSSVGVLKLRVGNLASGGHAESTGAEHPSEVNGAHPEELSHAASIIPIDGRQPTPSPSPQEAASGTFPEPAATPTGQEFMKDLGELNLPSPEGGNERWESIFSEDPGDFLLGSSEAGNDRNDETGDPSAYDHSPAPVSESKPEIPLERSGLPTRMLENGSLGIDLNKFPIPEMHGRDERWVALPSYDIGGISAGSHKGIGYKEHNEDRFVVAVLPEGGTALVSIDGVGGHPGGERAAAIVREVIQRCLSRGVPLDRAIEFADSAVVQDSYLPTFARPGAVVSGVEIRPNTDGSFSASFHTVGDAATAAFDLGVSSGNGVIVRTETHLPGQTLVARINPLAHYIDQAVGGNYRSGLEGLAIAKQSVVLHKGNVVLSGSDGFWENFRDYAEIADIMRATSVQSAEGLRRALMNDALVRMRLLEMRITESYIDSWTITRERYISAYRDVVGMDPPAAPWFYEGMHLEETGVVRRHPDLDSAVTGHFKADNVTLLVQIVGSPILERIGLTHPVSSRHVPASKVIRPRTIAQVRVMSDAFNFERSIVDKIPGLTHYLERVFQSGTRVVQNPEGDFRLSHEGGGAGPSHVEGADKESFRVFQQWNLREGFPTEEISDNPFAHVSRRPGMRSGSLRGGPRLTELKAFAASRGLVIEDHAGEAQAEYLQGILGLLPDSLFEARSPDNRPYLSGIRLNSPPVLGAKISAFVKGMVALYPLVMQGPRRLLLATTLHEIGHSTAYRYALGDKGHDGRPGWIEPDAGIPIEVRERMHASIDSVVKAERSFTLDWGGGASLRRSYCRSMQEFIAEFHLHHFVAGSRLRLHISNIEDPKIREAYRWIYDELHRRAFGEWEY